MSATAAEPKPETVLDHEIGPAQLDIPGMLAKAKRDSGRSTLSIAKEMGRFVLGAPKLTGDQYFAWRLYDDDRFTREEKDAFIGAGRSRRVNRVINYVQHFLSYVDNKLLFGATLTASGIAYPAPVAVFTKTRLPKGLGWVSTAGEVADFLRSTQAYPLFGKPIEGHASQSAGVISIQRYDAGGDCLVRHDGTTVPVETFAAEIERFFAEGSYLFQERIFPHPEIEAACGSGLGTVRIVTVSEDGRIYPLYSAWKITATDAVADNFWRKGNLLAHIDVATGELLRVRTGGGFRFEEVESHPETGARLLGWTLPDWERAVETVVDAHSLVHRVGIVGWDLALSSTGPTVIEANTFPNHTLYQDASGRGVYAPDLLRGVHERAATRVAERKAKARASAKKKNREWRKRELDNVRDGLRGGDDQGTDAR